MGNTMYRFFKDGHIYTVSGDNLLSAQFNAEFRFGVDLGGATYEVIYKLKTIRTGKIKHG